MFDQQEVLDLINEHTFISIPKLNGTVVFVGGKNPFFRINDLYAHLETYFVFRDDDDRMYISHWYKGELVNRLWIPYSKDETIKLKQLADSINN